MEDIIGDGACFTNAIASFLTGDQKNGISLKRAGHNYLVSNWINYFKEVTVFPVTVQVGVGDNAKMHTFTTEEEFSNFYNSAESDYVYGDNAEVAIQFTLICVFLCF